MKNILSANYYIWFRILLLVFFIFTYLIPLNNRLLWQPDETRYAEISREMLVSGDWIKPRLLGLRYFEKPLAGYWANNISQWLLGNSNFAVRFTSVISTYISTILIFICGWKIYNHIRYALLSSLFFLSTLLVLGVGTYNILDSMTALWLNMAMVSHLFSFCSNSIKKKILFWFLFGFACSLGFMTKGFLALVIPNISILPVSFYYKKLKEQLIYYPIWIVTFLLIVLPWSIIINKVEPDFWRYFIYIEHIQRFFSKNAQHCAPFWFYIPVILLGALPWSGLLPGSLFNAWKTRQIEKERFILLSWFIVPLLFFSLAKGKLLTYILSCMAPLSLLLALYVYDCINLKSKKAFFVNANINIIFSLLCIIFIIILSIVDKNILLIRFNLSKEWSCIVVAIIVFISWLFFGILSRYLQCNYWILAAFCPLFFIYFTGKIIPQSITDAKQPQKFFINHASLLKTSRYVLSNDVGIATSLAWFLKRSDIIMYDNKGELTYGLSYPDSYERYISRKNFPVWLKKSRKQGSVSLIILFKNKDKNIPKPNILHYNSRILLFYYK